MPVRAEVRRRAEYLERAVKEGIAPLWALIGVAIAVVGGSLTLVAIWGVKHLIWTLVIVLAVLLLVLAEGSYRVARHRETKHAERVAELEGERNAKVKELEGIRAELEKVQTERDEARHELAATPADPKPPPFELRYYTTKPPKYGDYVTSYFVGVTNPPGEPERTARMSVKRMDPLPRENPPYGVTPAFPYAVPPASGGAATAGLTIAPGQEESWFIGNIGIGSDGKINVWRFFRDLDASWELGPDERWRLSYRIECDGVPDVKFSIVLGVEGGQLAVRLED